MSNQPITTAEAVYIEADEDDSSSGYESSTYGSSTDSLASSLNKYLEENGRKYHAYYGQEKNFMPVDDVEKERLDIQHEVFRLVSGGKLHQAPLEDPQRVLDLGAGTGIWSIDFADANPQAEVTGIDLSPIQPGWVPPNCKFETDDLELDWTFPPNRYDFIYSRNVLAILNDAPRYISQIYNCVAPGGYVELTEIDGKFQSDDGSVPDDWPASIATELVIKGALMSGRKFYKDKEIVALLQDAGFEDITVKALKMPATPWPKDRGLKQAGYFQALQSDTLFHSYGLALYTRVLGMSLEEATRVCDEARDSIARSRQEKVHAWNYLFVVYAKKPNA